MKKLFGFIGALLITLSLLSTPAFADYSSQSQIVYNNGTYCLVSQAVAQSSNITGPYWTMTAYAEFGFSQTGGYCDTSRHSVANPGYLAAKVDVYRWTGSSWGYCWGSEWTYNDQITERWYRGQVGSYGYCGGGWYVAVSLAAFWDGSAYQGWQTPVWSTGVYLQQSPYRVASERV